jgi:TonB family protein
MKQRFGSNVLVWAFGLSILAHLAFVLFARVPRVEAAPETIPTKVQIVHVVPPTPAPTATPKPERPIARTTPKSSAVQRVHITLPQVNSPRGESTAGPLVVATSGAEVPGLPVGDPTASAVPPRPACSVPNAPARTITAAMPENPDGVAGLPATAEVEVTLDAAGHVTGLRIYRSAFNQQLDRAAIIAARTSTYAPALVDCLPAGGTYLFTVEFQD